MKNMKDLFLNYHIEINESQISLFKKYYDLLIEWNAKMNLTTITEYSDVIKKHFLDSCLLFRKYPKDNFSGKKIIDIGTGAGFPGIPLSIFLTDTEFVLMDSLNKRIEFLSVVVNKLHLKNITLIHGRAENFGKEEQYREQFDFCVSRAVAALPLLLEYCSPFIKVNGTLFFYKSKKTQEEIQNSSHALDVLNCKITDCFTLSEEADYERYLLQIIKNESTPYKYPRREGKPKKNPL